MTSEPKRRTVTLRSNEQLPVDHLVITTDRRVVLTIEAEHDVAIGLIRRADGTQREADRGN